MQYFTEEEKILSARVIRIRVSNILRVRKIGILPCFILFSLFCWSLIYIDLVAHKEAVSCEVKFTRYFTSRIVDQTLVATAATTTSEASKVAFPLDFRVLD